jgi:hypothetical protein
MEIMKIEIIPLTDLTEGRSSSKNILRALLLFALSLLLLGTGCANTESRLAKEKQTERTYENTSYREAIRANTVLKYEEFLKKYPNSNYREEILGRLNTAKEAQFESDMSLKINAGNYSQIVEMEASAEKAGYATALEKIRNEINSYEIEKVQTKGLILWEPQSDADHSEAMYRIRIVSSGTSHSSDTIGNMLKKSALAQLSKDRAPMLDSYFVFAEHPSATPGVTLYLYPEQQGDQVVISDGKKFKITSGASDKQKTIEVGALKQAYTSDRVFGVSEKMGEKRLINVSLVLAVKLPESNGLLEISGTGVIYVIDDNRVTFHSCNIMPAKALLSGIVRLPPDRWITIRPGFAVKGGTISFDEKHVLITENSTIARRK